MLRALLYLRLTSLQNRVARAVRRLREPRYLAGTAAAAAYFYFYLIRAQGVRSLFGHSSSATPATAVLAFVSAALFLLFLGRQALAWLLPPALPGLRFSEAEIGFLFPAPLSRRSLIHFSLLSLQLRVLVSAVVLVLVFNRGGGGLTHAVGWWIMLSAWGLHSTGIGLVAARQAGGRDRPARGRTAALAILALILLLAVGDFYRHARPPDESELSSAANMEAARDVLVSFAGRLFDSGLLHWLLLPFRWVAGPYAAATHGEFLRSLAPALAVVAGLYAWVVRLEINFEEGSIARAERQAQITAARKAGSWRSPLARPALRRDPFRLAGEGRPELAFLWKNLLSLRFNSRIAFYFLAVIGLVLFFSLHGSVHPGAPGSYAGLVLVAAAMVAYFALLVGPLIMRQDLRGDLANLDLLKAYPLAGWQVIVGEIITPVAIMCSLLWLSLLAAAWALSQMGATAGWQAAGERFALTLGAAAVVPPLCALQELIPNATALLFPNWFQSARGRTGGFEAMGQRMIFAFGQLFALALALLPAALLAAGVFLAARFWTGLALSEEAALVIATGASAASAFAVIGAEVALGLWWLGTRFEKLDLTLELRP